MRLIILITFCLLISLGKALSQSLYFPNGGSWINVGDLDISGNQITVEALVYLDQTAALNFNIVSKHTNPGDVNYLFRPLSFELTTYLNGNSGPTKFLQLFNPFTLVPNKWYHIAATYDGSIVKYYVNGCLVVDSAWSGNLVQNDLNTAIGNASNCQCEQFYGKIDEVRIWNVCRSQSEIVSNMLTLANASTQIGLIAYYKFDGDFINNQGNPVWNGTAVGTALFSSAQANIQPLAITGIQIQNSDCSGSNNGSITITSTRPDALYSINGVSYQSINSFGNLSPGILHIYVRTPEGCGIDSAVVIGNNNLFFTINISTSICEGQTLLGYSTSGIYIDTLVSANGCDSIRTINLTVQNFTTSSIIANICAGQTYTLPWGTVVSTAGTYRDTLRYATGCDSMRKIVNLSVGSALSTTTIASLCEGQNYTLPWGQVVNTTGNYKDTLRTAAGCDSLIRKVDLTVKAKPIIFVTKSNDVNCIIGTTKLNVYGAGTYLWSPASSLSNASSNSPIASPGITTTYNVSVTATNGCIAKDSIEVKMVNGNQQNSYLVPNSFSPNNDGLNDCFGVPYWGHVTVFDFSIFNIWGELVFHTTDSGNCWDGKYRGKMQNIGVYVYQITATGICGPVFRKGTVLLIR